MLQQTLFLLGMTALSSVLLASPGTLDKRGCHRDSLTQQYHCHEFQKKDHFLIGLTLSSNLWTYDNGPENFFVGGGISTEYAYRFLGIYADYTYKPHVTGNSTYYLSGWSTGLKLGPSIANHGIHPYATVGWFNELFALENSPNKKLSSYQFGVGIISNFQSFAVDIRALYRNPEEVDSMWQSYGAGGLNRDLIFELVGYLRF
jgi:hypothetical protein